MGNQKSQLDPDVAQAFNVHTGITLLPGGIDLKTYRSGDVVLRNLGQGAEKVAIWTAHLFDSVVEDGFRVAKPIRANNGQWIFNGWVAEKFLDGRHARKEDLPSVIDAINRFHAAIKKMPPPPKDESAGLSIYQRADQWAWGDIPADIDAKLYETALDLASLRKPVDLENQIIHGDLNLNNVLIADGQDPAIIDLAPYFRPPEFAQAVCAYWEGPYKGDINILDVFKGIREFDQMVIRAGIRMMLIQQDLHNPNDMEGYRRANEVIKRYVSLH